MSDDEAKSPRLFDVRTIDRTIRKGLTTRKDYDKYLKSLPDVADKAAPSDPSAADIEDDLDDDMDDDIDDEDDDDAVAAKAVPGLADADATDEDDDEDMDDDIDDEDDDEDEEPSGSTNGTPANGKPSNDTSV